METNNTQSPEPRRISDVVGPGKSPPNRTSKPIISSNLADAPDPMMASKLIPAPPSASPEPSPSALTGEVPPIAPVISSIHKSKSRLFRLRVMLFLVGGIIVLFIVADLLVDAGIVHTSVSPLTHFFHHHS